MHGNILYDFYYQSARDTPIQARDIVQHTLQTNLQLVWKDKYPFRIAFSTSKSNADFVRNITGVNMQYTNRDFKNMLLQKAMGWDNVREKDRKELLRMRSQLDSQYLELYQLQAKMKAPSLSQQIVEEKEKQLYGRVRDSIANQQKLDLKRPNIDLNRGYAQAGIPDPVAKDSGMANSAEKLALLKQRADSILAKIEKTQALYNRKRSQYDSRRSGMKDALGKHATNRELADDLESMNLPDSLLPKGSRTLLALRSVGIGRTMVDYSELTAKNISITGFQAEYNPDWYFAFATGAVDYVFRDYTINQKRSKQYLSIARLGYGLRDKSSIIFSFYTGRKQLYNFNTTAPDPGQHIQEPDTKLMGISLEGRWQVFPHHTIAVEAARSSLPYYKRGDQSAFSSIFSFNDHSADAIATTYTGFLPVTGTRMNAMVKKMNANFQSFSIYNTGSNQTAWSVKVDQPFWKQQLLLSAGIRKNDFNSVFENTSIQSNTIFKSLQLTLKRKRWPVLSVGYYPSSQLMKLDDGHYQENVFNTLTGTANYSYDYHHLMMNTNFTYTRFFNHATDSGFIYFNSSNLALNHTVFFGRVTLNGGLSESINPDYSLHGADVSAQWKLKSWLEVGGGLKYNYQTMYDITQLGYNGNLRIAVPKVGEFSFMGDQGYIPGAQRKLVSNKTGRIVYTKIF
ncbi:hypothetical protein [Chitinophaga sp. Cy-1792]|uniref:hypothetical protein n=1 Tax=Chitinophaga sp. Cy-1792 TaxID=2608339 RepID=UPI0014209EAD|nr:hypothetical protein [Chitinophaga sp. Cy-1792]NIG52799.1 hypothetical protein [Chitinophaga sp. Cy-1792]